jgi:hypothetical protein
LEAPYWDEGIKEKAIEVEQAQAKTAQGGN